MILENHRSCWLIRSQSLCAILSTAHTTTPEHPIHRNSFKTEHFEILVFLHNGSVEILHQILAAYLMLNRKGWKFISESSVCNVQNDIFHDLFQNSQYSNIPSESPVSIDKSINNLSISSQLFSHKKSLDATNPMRDYL